VQGFTFYLSIFNNIFAVCGLFGVVNAQRELIIAFFGYNAAQVGGLGRQPLYQRFGAGFCYLFAVLNSSTWRTLTPELLHAGQHHYWTLQWLC
jgi:hypothetical protein